MPNSNSNSTSVSFGEITVLEFPVVLGENPAVSSGAPIQLGWEPVTVITRDLDLYEYLRQDQRKSSRKGLVIGVTKRAQILLGAGYSIDEIAHATLEAEIIRKQRYDSLKASGGLGERFQNVLDATGKLPRELVKGVLRMATKPKQNTLQARSA